MLKDREKAFENKMAREEEYEFRLNAITVRNMLGKIVTLLPESQPLEELLQYSLHYQEESLLQDVMDIFSQNDISISEREIIQILKAAREEAVKAMEAPDEPQNIKDHNSQ